MTETLKGLIKRWRWAAGLQSTLPESKAQQAGWAQAADELEAALPAIEAEMTKMQAKLAKLEGIDQACDASVQHVLLLQKDVADLQSRLDEVRKLAEDKWPMVSKAYRDEHLKRKESVVLDCIADLQAILTGRSQADMSDQHKCKKCGQPCSPTDICGDCAEESLVAAVEKLAAEFHSVYEKELKRQGINSRHAAEYIELPEPIKNIDRALARFVLARESALSKAIQSARAEVLEKASEHIPMLLPGGPDDPSWLISRGACSCRNLVADGVTPWNKLWSDHLRASVEQP